MAYIFSPMILPGTVSFKQTFDKYCIVVSEGLLLGGVGPDLRIGNASGSSSCLFVKIRTLERIPALC